MAVHKTCAWLTLAHRHPDAGQFDRRTVSAWVRAWGGWEDACASGFTDVAVMVAPGCGVGPGDPAGYGMPSEAGAALWDGCAGPLSGRAGRCW